VFPVLSSNCSRPLSAVAAELASARRCNIPRVLTLRTRALPISNFRSFFPAQPRMFSIRYKRVRNTLKMNVFNYLHLQTHAHSFAASPAVSTLSQKHTGGVYPPPIFIRGAHSRDHREVPCNHRVLPHGRVSRPRISSSREGASLSMRGVPAKLLGLRATNNRALTDGR
jgi:hypothetical protein